MRRLFTCCLIVAALSLATSLASAADLSSNIMRRVNAANDYLDKAQALIEKGETGQAARPIGQAAEEFDNIHKYYAGSFDENHPTLVALKQRIDTLSASAKGAPAAASGGQAAQQGAAAPSGPPPLLREANEALIEVERGNYGNTDADYQRMQGLVETAERAYAELQAKGGVDKRDMMALESRVASARAKLDQLYKRTPAAAAAAQVATDKANEAKRQQIMARFKDQGMTSKVHEQHVGRIVWAKKEIGFKAQDKAELLDKFSLSDPIYGRIYLARSLGNTPIYSDQFAEPHAMREFDYDVRLYVDGKNVAVKFGVFRQYSMEADAGQKWTTFQLVPHAVPMEDYYKGDGEAWRKATSGLAEGLHEVRFEVYATNGSFHSRGPIAVGEFTLKVGAGERIAATGAFPATSYKGGDAAEIAAAMRKSLVGPVAKRADEIRDVSVTSEWNHRVYTDTKRRFRVISGAVLWADSNDDGVCRYTTYNFVSDEAGAQSWGPLRFHSFCNGCAEGNAECAD